MSENKLSIIHSLISVGILFFTILLIQQSNEHYLIYTVLFFIVKTLVDIVFHKLSYTFRGFGIRKMLILNLILLLLLVIWIAFRV